LILFPMQLDIAAGLHPVHHLTLLVEAAAWGGQTGAGTQIAGENVDLIGLHEAFVMTHEWPMNTYLKVGRFMPQYGTRLDDHTAYVRRNLGFDPSRPSAWVSGVEAGFTANYPYVSVSVFKLDAGQHDFFPTGTGEGVSATAGWRDLIWSVGGSFYKSGSPEENRLMVGASWSFNPWRFWPRFPFTYLGEVDWVSLETAVSGQTARQLAAFHELDWLPFNGVDFRLRYDYFDPNLDLRDDHEHRLNAQVDFHPFRYLEFQFVLREHLPAVGQNATDFLTILHAWL